MPNLLLEQYARYKKPALNSSPYSCLLNTNIELNPHQINAFCAAIQALRTGGIILAEGHTASKKDFRLRQRSIINSRETTRAEAINSTPLLPRHIMLKNKD